MKRLKSSLQNIEGAEVLTRAKMKNVIGGIESPKDNPSAFSCRCTKNDKSAGMEDCANCDTWCKDNGGEKQDICIRA